MVDKTTTQKTKYWATRTHWF